MNTKLKASTPRWDIMALRKPAMILSLVLLVISVASLATRGLNFGVDFTGGYVIDVAYPEPVDLDVVRGQLAEADFGDATVQHFGNAHEVLIRLPLREGLNRADLSERALEALSADGSQTLDMRRNDFVGPQVGEELREQGGLSVLAALFCIVIYIWLRFEKKFSVGSVLALVHDVIILSLIQI